MGIPEKEWKKNPALRAAVEADIARGGHSKPKRNRRNTLVGKAPHQKGVVDIAGPLLVRITRVVGRGSEWYDRQNLVGGAKRVQDAIAAFLSRKGDSEKDGLWWEYRQVPAASTAQETEIVIEIFQKENLG